MKNPRYVCAHRHNVPHGSQLGHSILLSSAQALGTAVHAGQVAHTYREQAQRQVRKRHGASCVDLGSCTLAQRAVTGGPRVHPEKRPECEPSLAFPRPRCRAHLCARASIATVAVFVGSHPTSAVCQVDAPAQKDVVQRAHRGAEGIPRGNPHSARAQTPERGSGHKD